MLKDKGKVYGCNAIYRDFMPDYLVAVDSKMVDELVKNSVETQTEVWTNYNKLTESYKGLRYFNPSKGWSSGPSALMLASLHKHTTIYILGFDFIGLDNNTFFNNVYADTDNYKKSTETATYYGNWFKQTTDVFKDFDDIKYVRVTNGDSLEWGSYNNFRQISYLDFKNEISY